MSGELINVTRAGNKGKKLSPRQEYWLDRVQSHLFLTARWPLSGSLQALSYVTTFFLCSLLKPKFVFFLVKNFSKMEAYYNKWYSCPIYKSYWYVSYSSLLFFFREFLLTSIFPILMHRVDSLLTNSSVRYKNHAFLSVSQPSGPSVHFFRGGSMA